VQAYQLFSEQRINRHDEKDPDNFAVELDM
jgi:hypothetical protein